jgi:hypothetical protein
MEKDELATLRTHSPNGRSFSDGDIYRNLRYCQLYAPSQTPFWSTQLSARKRELEQMSSQCNAPLQFAIDALIPYVGEWREFPLGVLQRLLTMKANKASCHSLHVYSFVVANKPTGDDSISEPHKAPA